MPRYLRWLLPVIVLVVAMSGCALTKPEPTTGRWIRFDPTTQRYGIEAWQVPRGALLDELAIIAKADVRPQSERDAPVTAKAAGLDLEALVALLLPPGAHVTVRAGDREIASATSSPGARKEGPPLRPDAGLVAKRDAAADTPPDLKHPGPLKAAADLAQTQRESSGPGTKPQAATLLRTAQGVDPKKPLATRVERATVRLTLQFEDGAAPRVVDAQTIEGRAPVQRFVVGTYVFAVFGADGRLLEAGTFNDPLVERSYQQEGPHAVLRAKTGVVGISIARENLSGARLKIVDMTGLPMPRELNEEVVRAALDRGRMSLQTDTQSILRRLDQETK